MEPKLERVQGLCSSRQSPLLCGYGVGSELPSRCLASAWSQRPPPGRQRPGFICHAGGRSLGEVEGPGAASKGRDGNAQFSASLERPPPRLEGDHEVTLAPGLSHPWGGVCFGSRWEGVWPPGSAPTPSWASWITALVWLDVAGVQGQSAQHQQRSLSLLAGKRLALVKLG